MQRIVEVHAELDTTISAYDVFNSHSKQSHFEKRLYITNLVGIRNPEAIAVSPSK